MSDYPQQRKIINDPVHGFIRIPTKLILKLINHPYFQRLRRIKQLGLTEFVYPGALHTRFHHALGAMNLMRMALDTLRLKEHKISHKEYESALIAILLHDIGHGAFSHALECTILKDCHHEELSLLLMEKLDEEFNGQLKTAIEIFKGNYHRPFFHQLVSGQLDVDRMDYLQRDCFFTGVSEGTIGGERIIRMLNLSDDKLVVEEKGVYSIEHFLNARRMMYWQVYLHKTTVSTEQMLIQTIRRARFLVQNNTKLFATPSLSFFLENEITLNQFKNDKSVLDFFVQLDDYDIWASIKVWTKNEDKILSSLSNMLVNRRLFKTHLTTEELDQNFKIEIKEKVKKQFGIGNDEISFLVCEGKISNSAYALGTGEEICILKKNGEVIDITNASDIPYLQSLTQAVTKNYFCYPKMK
ncbi:HD domain-containing protein [Bernardetia sp. Wsw4-3y2]|uniref:HD domain-containing protein n=1 Tax=Bernardetia sp. Wsw4-3y2 TaxID=3127471 RepID=UPI0030D00BF5